MKTARERILEFKNLYPECRFNTQLIQHVPGQYAIMRAEVIVNDQILSSGTKMKKCNGETDDTYVAAAETIALGRAIGLYMANDETIHTQEEYAEMLRLHQENIWGLYNAKTSMKVIRAKILSVEDKALRGDLMNLFAHLQSLEASNEI